MYRERRYNTSAFFYFYECKLVYVNTAKLFLVYNYFLFDIAAQYCIIFLSDRTKTGDRAMREYGIMYDLNDRTCYEIFAVCSSTILCKEVEIIKNTGGYIISIDCIN